jgi:SUKH-3 immunity protein of toxin-antitoxin system
MALEISWPYDVEQIMTEAGWYPTRHVTVDAWVNELCVNGGFSIFPAARSILEEFGGLRAECRGPGLRRARGGFDLTPTLAIGEEDRYEAAAAELGVHQLFPLGEAYGGHEFMAADAYGRIYILGIITMFVGKDMYDAIRNILLGDI